MNANAIRGRMSEGVERRVVLVTRRSRLQELIERHNTLEQARFYIEHMGANFKEYRVEHNIYQISLGIAIARLQTWGRYQVIDRQLLPNYLFAPSDIVVALGQDGVVANTMKYLNGQPLIGLKPNPIQHGQLSSHIAAELPGMLEQLVEDRLPMKTVTMAEVRLSDGQTLRAVNDFFIGARTHTSALYELSYGGRTEYQSSSGLIVSTGLGSTAWMKSVVTGSMAIAKSLGEAGDEFVYQPRSWDAPTLDFAVREPFPTSTTQATLVYGRFAQPDGLKVRSCMPDNGVIFSDGLENDFLRFTAGMEATITVAPVHGLLAQ